MDDSTNSLRPYFQVERPAHFLARKDVVEELCLAEQILRTLPKAQKEYEVWLQASGYSAVELPFADLQSRAAKRYERTERYVLKSPVLPGRLHRTNVITDGNLWPFVTEQGGLPEFIINRAVEFCVSLGMRHGDANDCFRLNPRKEPCDYVRNAPWAVGYEKGSGYCTILEMNCEETERLYLQGRPGYLTPFADGI
jgi:hypothetical protein